MFCNNGLTSSLDVAECREINKLPNNMNITDVALKCVNNGFSIIPIKGGTKKPMIKWEQFQQRVMTPYEVRNYFVDGCSIALVAGSISRNLQCLDFDAPHLFSPFCNLLQKANPELHERITVWQQTPSGGFHILVRSTELVPGSQKLAMSEPYKDDQGHRRQDVLIETRGQGG